MTRPGMVISRFAPAPTGYLHLGHVLNAIYVWGITTAAGGRVLLRIEDHDRQRSRPEFARALCEDLEWLGFVAAAPPVRQSERTSLYASALDRLADRGLVFACECSRAGILEGSGQEGELRYPGTCRNKALSVITGRGVRVRLDPSVERFTDLRHGPLAQRPSEQCGDLLARDRDANWTYQFSVAVDDMEQGVNLVIRGDDLIQSTGRQIQLARLLGRHEPPTFLHHSLIMKTPTQKLSKSDSDTSVRDLRVKGMTPSDVLQRAAALGGLPDDQTALWSDLHAGLRARSVR